MILVGDLIAAPNCRPQPTRLAFEALLGYGLVDTWAVANPGHPGYTARFNELLDDPVAEGALERRVDHVTASSGSASFGHASTGPTPTTAPQWPLALQ